ncbi:hypothetical protein [Nocardia australiensis]|uniref:hypothetical protein n=1 Tax=Nocardia australiensis TaxID=2887191 RepID=UPI001D13E794|nr:hypothetical protein [Nocardia australiensis]
MRRPRALVLDEVWRGLDGVEPLSGPQGGPLRRTVKLILDPLVIRPVQHPQCAGPIVTPDGARLLATRVHAATDVLRATAAWFTLLKQVRRTLRITEGNPQDLYFQRCYELATTMGMPDPAQGRATAEATLRDVHEFAAGRTTTALKEYITEGSQIRELVGLIDVAWRRRPAGATTADHRAQFTALLDACAAARLGQHRDRDDNGQAGFDRLVKTNAGTHSGIELWHQDCVPSAHQLGLTVRPAPQPPALGTSASTSTLGLPFDRTIYERVFTALQASSDRAELPPIPDLVTIEIARSCSPWALLDESLRVAAAAGTELALGLSPIGDPAQRTDFNQPTQATQPDDRARPNHSAQPDHSSQPDHSARPDSETQPHSPAQPVVADVADGRPRDNQSPAQTAAHRVINGRWQREAYVLQARRLVVSAAGAGSRAGPLADIAAELRTPWRPYLRRLWVRLHGRDVRETAVYDPNELWDLLDGVARSVMLDHRMRVKQALSLSSRAPEADSTESRAS